ncbi:hypothetical protein ACDN41_11695 [Priestia aryabhattai]|uniref:hypothetical protein n=1 Tax=Priestia aryabhattai TaxID=412384 RepID=UPI0035327AC8
MREQVKWFAEQMESKLQENDFKGGWDLCGRFWLLERIIEEVEELKKEMMYQHNGGERDDEATIRECCDVANFAMMLADKTKKRPNYSK